MNTNNYGLVTVLMSVCGSDLTRLKRAVKSILNQTYTFFEFIIIDDCADEKIIDYLSGIKDDRVSVFNHEKNLGLAASLNQGIMLAKGDYIARMDADDYSFSNRLYEQAKYMAEHDEVDVLACISLDIKNECITGGIGGAYRKFDNEDMRIELSFAPKTYPHPSVMFRTSFLRNTGIRYDESFIRAQDYDMWAAISLYGRLDSLQKSLLLYDVGNSTSTAPSELQIYYSNLTKLKCLSRLLPNATEREKDLYIHFRDMELTGTVNENLELVNSLLLANRIKNIYNNRKYSEIIYFWLGRKMLYSENREFLKSFLSHPKFVICVVWAFICRLPGHLAQKEYENRIIRKALKKGDSGGKIFLT